MIATLKFNSKWSYVLLSIAILDSLLTAYVFQGETNPMWFVYMSKLDLSLPIVMVIRILYLLPLIYVLDRLSKRMCFCTVLLYMMIYFWFMFK